MFMLVLTQVNAGMSHTLQATSQDNRLMPVKRVIEESGWKIPGLEQSLVTDPRKLLPSGYGVSSVPLHITVLKPKREYITTISLYGFKDNGETIVVKQRQAVVRSIIKCDVNNRVFVYILHCVIVQDDPVAQRGGYGGVFGVHYYDNDGDGKFESYEDGSPFVTSELRIPDWVLKNQ
jgi:hypothetical protein